MFIKALVPVTKFVYDKHWSFPTFFYFWSKFWLLVTKFIYDKHWSFSTFFYFWSYFFNQKKLFLWFSCYKWKKKGWWITANQEALPLSCGALKYFSQAKRDRNVKVNLVLKICRVETSMYWARRTYNCDTMQKMPFWKQTLKKKMKKNKHVFQS